MSTVVRPVYWEKSRNTRSMIQFLEAGRYPEDYEGTRRSICGNGVKSGELFQPDYGVIQQEGVCSRCLQVLAKGDYVLEDGRSPLEGIKLNLPGCLRLDDADSWPRLRLRLSALADRAIQLSLVA